MLLVEGNYCPRVKHECLKHTKEWEEDQEHRERAKAQGLVLPPSKVSERCLIYAQPAQCLSEERVAMRFCMDRYEWPNVVGEKPMFLVSWLEAKAACESKGKRLCTEDEFNFACEGEQMLPYAYGYERDAKRCNIDKPYVYPRRQLLPYAMCEQTPSCKEHMDELDQREPIGSRDQCTSPFGIHDLNGNVNEWVARPNQTAPTRSGLKGGWWGPARSRCRPMVTIHKEMYVGYEVGFRCCKDAPRLP